MESFVRYLLFLVVTLTLTCVKVGAFRVQQIDTRQITEDGDEDGLRVLAVSSSGVKEDGSVTVAVQLAGHTTHTLEPNWVIYWKRGNSQQIERRLNHEYWSVVDVSNASSAERVIFQISLDDHIVIFDFFEFKQKTNYSIARPEFSLQLNKTYTTREGHDLEIDVVVNGNYSHVDTYFNAGTMSFIYVNTSSEPAEMQAKLLTLSDAISIRLESLTDESTKVHITLKQKYAKFGGYLMVNSMRKHDTHAPGHLVNIYFIKILSPEFNEAIPPNTVGIYELPNNVVVSNEYLNGISCYVMGNPKPEVSILKLKGYGVTEFVPGVFTRISTEAMTFKELRLGSSDPEVEGLYICRAKAGTTTIEKRVEVYKFKLAVFDDSLTGVMGNTTDGVIISCQASGKPRPRLGIHANDPNGPDVSDLITYQVSRTLIDDMTERVTLTVSPSNPINTVYCTAYQEHNRGVDNVRKIDVYPDPGEVGNKKIISEMPFFVN